MTVQPPTLERPVAAEGQPSPEVLFREARKRRRRRWAATGAVVLVIAVAGAVISADVLVPGSRGPNHSKSTQSSASRGAVASAHWCMANQLRAQAGNFVPHMGGTTHQVLLFDTGGPCRLSGNPTLFGVKADGAQVKLAVAHGPGARRWPTNVMPTVLTRHEAGEVVIATGGGICGALTRAEGTARRALWASNTYHTIVIALPNDRGSVEARGLSIQATCAVGISALGTVPPPYGGPLGSTATLSINMMLPTTTPVDTVRSGQLLPYTISFYDWTKAPVSLRSCPHYSLRIYATLPTKLVPTAPRPAPLVRHTALLDCAERALVIPGEYVSFHFMVRVPRARKGASLVFTWRLDVRRRGLTPTDFSVGRASTEVSER